MPAPTPITVRYGDDGLLGAAAAATGLNTGLLQLRHAQQQRDDDFINQELNRRANADIASQQAQLQLQAQAQAGELQRAHDLVIQRQNGSSSDPNYFRKTSPLVQAVTQAKQDRLRSLVGDSGIDTSNYESQLNDPNVPADFVFKTAENDVRRSKVQKATQAKQQVLKEAAATGMKLPPDVVALMNNAVNDEGTTPEELRAKLYQSQSDLQRQQHQVQADATAAANKSATERRLAQDQERVATHQKVALQINDLDNQAKDIATQIKEYTDSLKSASYDPATVGPDAFKSQPIKLGIFDRLTGKPTETKGDPEGLAAYKKLAELKQAHAAILKKRQELLQAATGGSDTSAPDSLGIR